MIFDSLKKLWLPQTNLLMRGPNGGLLRGPGGGLAGHSRCCCGTKTCEKFRGILNEYDVHTHDSSIYVVMTDWDHADDWPHGGAVPVADDNCCDDLNAVYELPIRDYDTADATEWGYFTTFPGIFFPNCTPCYDCDELEPHTWAFLTAYCDECNYDEPPEANPGYSSPCRPWVDPDETLDTVWTLELIINGYHGTNCGAGHLCDLGNTLVKIVWAKTLPSSAAPHTYSGIHDLELKEWTGRKLNPAAPEPAERWLLYNCHPPTTVQLYAGDEP